MTFESREINWAGSTLGLDLLCEMCPMVVLLRQGHQEPREGRSLETAGST